MRAYKVFVFSSAACESVNLLDFPVIKSNGKTVAFHIHCKVFAHNRKTYQSYIRFFHRFPPFEYYTVQSPRAGLLI